MSAAPLHAAELLEPSVVDSKTYTESYNITARLSDGSFIHASAMISNIGLRSRRGICRLQRIANGHVQSKQQVVEADGWHYTAARAAEPAMLTVGACQIAAEPNALHWRAKIDELAVDLRLDGVPQARPTPGYPVRQGERFYDSTILAPFAKASVQVGDPPAAAPRLSGFGYADHSRSTLLPTNLAYGWLRFRGGKPGCGRLLLVRFVQPAQGNKPPRLAAYIWREGDAEPHPLNEPHISLPAEASDPKLLKASLFDGARHLFTVRGQASLVREAPFEDYGLLGRMVGAMVGKVVTETYAASLEDAEAQGACKDVDGVLEVDHLGN